MLGEGQILTDLKSMSIVFSLQPVPLGVTRRSRERGPASPAPPTAAPARRLPASAPATVTSTVRIRTLQTAPVPVSTLVALFGPTPGLPLGALRRSL